MEEIWKLKSVTKLPRDTQFIKGQNQDSNLELCDPELFPSQTELSEGRDYTSFIFIAIEPRTQLVLNKGVSRM